jgi:hypothetical protein
MRLQAIKVMALQKNSKIKIFKLCPLDNAAVPLYD